MRRAKWFVLIGVCVVVTALAGCLPGRVVRIDATYNGRAVTVPLDGKLIVSLDSNATTGYAWALEEVDASILANEGSKYIAPVTMLVGVGGTEEWTFGAIAVGQTALKLKYVRSFEPEGEPAGTFEVAVTVE
ncbi:MAG: protease inhibitor I42 family protein [Phycisphaerales bacterium]|nr:protease inhibitor I42 family protein [Phycisphaerales bacterium]